MKSIYMRGYFHANCALNAVTKSRNLPINGTLIRLRSFSAVLVIAVSTIAYSKDGMVSSHEMNVPYFVYCDVNRRGEYDL